MQQKQNNNSMRVRIAGLLIGILLNAFGNGLTISSNTGSAVYTASAVDLYKLTGIGISIYVFGWGFLNTILNQFLIKHWDWVRFVKGVTYTLFFSYFVDIFLNLVNATGLPNQTFIIRTIFSLIGTTLIGISISIYQRANLLMHPNDELTNILRFDYLHGNVVLAQAIDLSFPVIVIIISSILLGHVYAVGFATIVYFIFNGTVIKYADRYVWPHLIHNF